MPYDLPAALVIVCWPFFSLLGDSRRSPHGIDLPNREREREQLVLGNLSIVILGSVVNPGRIAATGSSDQIRRPQ